MITLTGTNIAILCDNFVNLQWMERDWLDLFELQQQMREGIEQIFPGRLWVRAEIASVQVKANGHCYLDLSQSEGGKVIAKAKAIIWRSRYIPVVCYFKETTGEELKPGMEVLARVVVSYSELYGLSLTIDELEPRFTMGAAELQRRQTIEQLEKDIAELGDIIGNDAVRIGINI